MLYVAGYLAFGFIFITLRLIYRQYKGSEVKREEVKNSYFIIGILLWPVVAILLLYMVFNKALSLHINNIFGEN